MGKTSTYTEGSWPIYGLLIGSLVAGRLLLATTNWQYPESLYRLSEFTAAFIALFVSLLALVRFYTRQNIVFLFIGTAFIGAFLLDGYEAILAGLFPSPIFANLPSLAESWNVSTTFTSILLTGSWLAGRREKEAEETIRLQGPWLYASFFLTTIVLFLFFTFAPRSAPNQQIYRLGRIEIYVSSTFFLLALIGYWDKGEWRRDPFEHWLVMALIISLAGQALFMIYSVRLLDPMFTAAHWLKLASYIFVLIGLLRSMYAIFKQAEWSAADLVEANRTLQQEIRERKRIEMAEHEQRELAEALREVGIALSATLDFEELLDRLLDQIARVLPYDTANVMLVKGQDGYIFGTRGYEKFQIEAPKHFPVAKIPSLQQMMETGEPLIVPDTAVHPQWVRADQSPHVRSWAGAPISVKDQVIAFLALNNSKPNFYHPEDAARLAAFTGQASIAIQNASLYEEVQMRLEELTALNKISQAVISTLDLEETLAIVTRQTNQLLDVVATSVGLYDETSGKIWFAAASGEAADFVRGKKLELGQGILGWVVQNGQPLLIPDVRQDERYFSGFDQKSGFTARSILCVPLQTKGKVIGAIEALNKIKGQFDEDDLYLLALMAAPVAAAIENAQLYTKAQQEIFERMRAENTLEAERALLAQRVAERTADLSAANAELARAARLKDEFLASMSHELRTPLNAILGMSEALQEEILGPLNDNQKYSLRTVEESGRHLLSLINDILDVSKIEAGKLTLNRHPVSIASICQASLRFIKQDALSKQIRVSSEIDEQVTILWADERRLKQILVNLLSNAVKFTPKGGQVGLKVEGDEAHETVEFIVWDTGIGISQEDATHLFQPFVQLDSRLNRQFTGTGLGLSIVYRMTELHGGGVSLESRKGEGSRFIVSLPWQQTAVSETDADLTPSVTGDDGRIKTLTVKQKATVLLAEDNEANIQMMHNYLAAKRYEVVVARNGEEALARAREQRPDIVLMDIQMPVMDGLEATRRLRLEEGLQNVPIIALTALTMPGDQDRCLEAGADLYFSKPVSLKMLVAKLEEVLQGSQTGIDA